MSRPRVYVAGAMQADFHHDVHKNLARAIALSAELVAEGFAPFCPHLQAAYLYAPAGDRITLNDLMETDEAYLRTSDAVLLVPFSERSQGTRDELIVAEQLGVKVFRSIGKLIEWRENHESCDRKVAEVRSDCQISHK